MSDVESQLIAALAEQRQKRGGCQTIIGIALEEVRRLKNRDALLATLLDAARDALPYLADTVERGAMPDGEDDSGFGDRMALDAMKEAIAAVEKVV